MKKIKRVLALITCCLLLLSTMPITGTAATQNSFEISCSSASAYTGTDVSLNIILNNNPGFSALNIALVYDTTYLTQTSITNNVPSLYMTNGTTVVWDGAENYTDDGVLATVTFAVADNAPVGDYEIKVVFLGASNDDFEEVSAVVNDGKIKVKCPHNNTSNIPAKSEDCVENGYTAGIYCNDCKTYISGHTIIPATGHTSSDWITDKSPTCTEKGSAHKECTVCGDTLNTLVLPANGHSYIVADSMTEHPHTVTYTCSVCGGGKTANPYLSTCVECNFSLSLNESDEYVLETYIGTATDISIPASYNGIDIAKIANDCFRNNTFIKTVEIENGVTTIGSLAFMNCSSLKKVVIPESVTNIGARAFYDFTGVIYCASGSVAHQYAVDNNIKYILVTDEETEKPIQETVNTQIDYENRIIRTDIENCDDISEILNLSESGSVVLNASYVYSNIELCGTGTIITVFDGNRYIGDFTLIVNGDINGDSVCDVLDSSYVALVSSGKKTLDGAYEMAADVNSDGIIDINDYQSIVNKSVL